MLNKIIFFIIIIYIYMEPNINNINSFNILTKKDYYLINELIELYNKNKSLLGGFINSYKKDNEFAKVLEIENNSILANELKKEQKMDLDGLKILIGGVENILLKFKKLDLEKKLKNIDDKELLEKIKNQIGGHNKINKNLNKQLVKLGIEYYKRQYLRYKLKYIFNF